MSPVPPHAKWWHPWNGPMVVNRSDAQIALILEKLEGTAVDVHRGTDGTVDYIRRTRVLTDVGAVPAVYDRLRRTPPPQSQRGNSRVRRLHKFDLELEPGQTLDDVLDDLDEHVGEGRVAPDYLLHVCPTWCGATEPQPTTETTPSLSNTDSAATGEGIRVAVVDTGALRDVVRDHDWLNRPQAVTGDPEPAGIGHYAGHGTFIAGVVRALAPRSSVTVDAVTTMGGTVFESDMVDQLIDALDRDPQVISFSGGTRTRNDRPLKSFELFYEEHLEPRGGDTVFVAAAGNDGDGGRFWPAAFDWAVGVGALDDDGESLAGYSNRGEWVDVYALGTEVVNAYPKTTYEYLEPPEQGQPDGDFRQYGMASWSGTSFAAPMVAGLIAARMTWNGATARETWEQIDRIARADRGPQMRGRLRDARAASRP